MEHFNTANKLHTDVLEAQYGPIHSKVVKHDDFMREVFLVDETEIARTYALTFLQYKKNNTEMCEIDRKIKEGGLIGKTFRDYGFEVRKNVTGVFVIDNPDWLRNEFSNDGLQSKARLSEFYARKGNDEPVVYGTVLEVYSPDFRPALINAVDQAQTHPTTLVLEQAGFTKTEIYNCLGERVGFNTEDERYQNAQEFMALIPDPTKEKFITYIAHKE